MKSNISPDVLKFMATDRLINERLLAMVDEPKMQNVAKFLMFEYKHQNVDLPRVLMHTFLADELYSAVFPELMADAKIAYLIHPIDGMDECVLIYYHNCNRMDIEVFHSLELAENELKRIENQRVDSIFDDGG